MISFPGRAYLTWNYADTDEINFQKADWVQIERKTTASTKFTLNKALKLMGIESDDFYEAVQQEEFQVKFIYSEKVTKFCEIFTLLLTGTTLDKSKVKISQNFVAFSEYMNFNFYSNLTWSIKG